MGVEVISETKEEEPVVNVEPVEKPISAPPKRAGHISWEWRDNASKISLIGLLVLGVIALLFFARAFFLPLAFAIMLNFLLKPVVKWLARLKVPPGVSAAMVLVVVLAVLGTGISQLSKPASEFVGKLPENLHQIENKLREFVWHANRISKAAAEVQDLAKANPGEPPPPEVKVSPNRFGGTLFSATSAFVAGVLEAFVMVYFFLAFGERSLEKLVKALPTFHEKKRVTSITHEVQHQVSTFLFTITLINCVLGTLVGLGVWLVGLTNPVLWGAAAALLNFIPYFGPVVGVSILALAGLLTFDSVAYGLIPPLIYLGLHLLEANFLTPMILGHRLTLNPLVIFISFMFWTWLWGIPGALLSVPLLMTFKIVCDHVEPLRPVGEFLSG